MKIKKWKILLLVILILILVFIGITVSKNRQLIGLFVLPSLEYKATILPLDTTDLFEYDGYIKNDIVYIYVQGGPNWELFDRKMSPLNAIPHIGTYISVYTYQSQILNRTILAATPALTGEQAQQEVSVSAEMVYKTIAFFKNRNKKVYVFCVSHGSQIGLEILRRYPPIYDKLALTMIRLDMDNEAINLSNDGEMPYFDENQKLTSRYLLPSFLRFPRLTNRVNNMTMLMKVGKNKYTELLRDKDLSNVVFVYGKYDDKVGRPKSYELDFLRNKGVAILELDCGHDELGNKDYINRINQLLLDD